MTRSLKEIERDTNDRSLHHRIIRLAARVAEGEVCEHEAGNAALLDDISRGADYDGWDPIRLKVARDQTHGLMADRSERDEQRAVNGVGATEI